MFGNHFRILNARMECGIVIMLKLKGIDKWLLDQYFEWYRIIFYVYTYFFSSVLGLGLYNIWYARSGFGARFWKTKKIIRGIVWNQSWWKWFKLLFGFILIIYFCLVLQIPKRAPKPLLGRQNCVTSTGGRHNLVPGLHSYRWGPAWCVIYITDHAGSRRYKCNPCTMLWRPPVEVTQFWRPRSGFGARFFVKPKKIILIKRRGNSRKQKLLEMIQVSGWWHPDHLFLFGL